MNHSMGTKLRRGVAISELEPIANSLGPITWDPRHPEPVRLIRPQEQSKATPNSLSSRYGTGSFPFHTDAAHWRHPPEYVLLYCCAPGAASRATLLLDTATLALTSAERNLLHTGVWATARRQAFLTAVVEGPPECETWRFDRDCMRPWSPSAEAAGEVLDKVLDERSAWAHHWLAGDLLIIPNRHVLHSRAQACCADGDRVLARVLVGGRYA